MRRSEMVCKIREKMLEVTPDESGARVILDMLEELGMKPPQCACALVEDTVRGGLKHGPVANVWDPEQAEASGNSEQV